MPKTAHKSLSKQPPELVYERVKFLCAHSVYEAERELLLELSHGSATRLSKRIKDCGITLDIVRSLTPTELVEKYFANGVARPNNSRESFLQPDFAELSRELMRSMNHSGGSTNKKLELQRQVLYEDIYCSEKNKQRCAELGLKFYSLSHFYRLFREYEKSGIPPSFRRPEPAGSIAEFDFTGVTMRCADGTNAEFAVLVLNYSRKIYVEALPSQNTGDSSQAIVNGFRYFGGVTETLRVDNFKAAITQPGRYGGEATAIYRMLSNFLGFQLSSMPPRSGWLKGAVEAAVKIVTHTLISRMKLKERNEGPFPNIAAMNVWLRANLGRVNDHAVRGLRFTRNELFEQDERQALRQVSSWDFHIREMLEFTVGVTARLDINDHQYAVPASLIGRKVRVELKPQQIVIYESGRPVCTYPRLDGVAGLTTKAGYTPQTHLFIEVLKATPHSMYLEWAQAIGPETLKRVQKLLQGHPNIDKYRRAVKFLGLPRENPDCYPVFESFLKEQSPDIGVSRLAELWKQHPNKPDSTKKDPIYAFGRLFKMVEAKLFGESSELNWNAGEESVTKPAKGVVFLNYHADQQHKTPSSINSGDLNSATAGDLISADGTDLNAAPDLRSEVIHPEES